MAEAPGGTVANHRAVRLRAILDDKETRRSRGP
jgi:hypothetical protein